LGDLREASADRAKLHRGFVSASEKFGIGAFDFPRSALYSGVPQISRETTEQILAATDIVDVIGSYINVKRAGPSYKALCPFHNEKTPSFNINPVRQFFHCFGCGKSGDAITFVREYENLTFSDAVKKLASRAGIAVVEEATDPKEDRARRQRGRLLDLHREVTDFMHQMLFTREATHAREYLKSRGFGKEMAEGWKIGWMPERSETFLQWARGKDFKRGEWIASGFFVEKERGGIYVRFLDRLMFPIRNEIGDVIGFSGRQLRHDPRSGKYINSPETAIFKKSNVLFALERARKAVLKENAVVICEGQVDTIRCHESGIENVIGTQGTALTPNHAKLLRRYAKNSILCFDSDNAGLEAAEKAFRVLVAEGIPVKVARMPQGEDPDSFIQKQGPDAFREVLANAVDFFDFKIERAASENRLDSLQQRSAFARDCSDLLALITDPIAREDMINHVATRLKTGIPELRDAVAKTARRAKNKPPERDRDRDRNAEPEPEKTEPITLEPVVGYLCSLALHSSAAQERIGEQFEAIHEAADFIEGISLLETILSSRPDASSHVAVNGFIASLPEEQRLALHADSTFYHDPPGDPLAAADDALAHLSANALYRRDLAIKAQLGRPDLAPDQMIRLLHETKEVAELLKGLDHRYIYNDRFAPVKKAQKPPFSRGNRSFSKPENNP
jgi:DNA primase